MPCRLRILPHVFALGTFSQPAASKTARMVLPPHAEFSARTASTAASISGAVLEGCRCGQRLWSQRRWPSAARLIHLYPVFRLIPNSRHTAPMLFFPLDTAFTTAALCGSTILIDQGILLSSFASVRCLYSPRILLPMSLPTGYLCYYSVHVLSCPLAFGGLHGTGRSEIGPYRV